MSVTKARSRVANTAKNHPTDVEAITEARRDLAVAKIEAYVKRVVDAAPPLTDEQRDRLALLLRGPSDSGGAAA